MTGKSGSVLGMLLASCCLVAVSCSGGTSDTNSTGVATVQAGGGSSTAAPTSSASAGGGTGASVIDGSWNGTWTSTAGDGSSGTFTVVFAATGSAVTGTLKISEPCLDGAKVTGTLNGGSIDFGAVQGQCQVAYKGTVNGDQMSGTYSLGAAGGNWEAARS